MQKKHEQAQKSLSSSEDNFYSAYEPAASPGDGDSLDNPEITKLLLSWYDGDDHAMNEVLTQVYESLRSRAERYLGREQAGHTLQPTALINEVYLRLAKNKRMRFQNRAHFFWFAGEIMRRILVEYARAKLTQKRGAGAGKAFINTLSNLGSNSDVDLSTIVRVDRALSRLDAMDPRQGRIVTLRFFAGMNVEEISNALAISPTTVKREWRTAKVWLARELSRATA